MPVTPDGRGKEPEPSPSPARRGSASSSPAWLLPARITVFHRPYRSRCGRVILHQEMWVIISTSVMGCLTARHYHMYKVSCNVKVKDFFCFLINFDSGLQHQHESFTISSRPVYSTFSNDIFLARGSGVGARHYDGGECRGKATPCSPLCIQQKMGGSFVGS
jgi:hypothetical protein